MNCPISIWLWKDKD